MTVRMAAVRTGAPVSAQPRLTRESIAIQTAYEEQIGKLYAGLFGDLIDSENRPGTIDPTSAFRNGLRFARKALDIALEEVGSGDSDPHDESRHSQS